MSSDGDYHVVFKTRPWFQGFDFEEKFGVKFNDFTCATLKCWEAPLSYIECLSERRSCLIPDVVESRSVDVYVFHFRFIIPLYNVGNERKVNKI